MFFPFWIFGHTQELNSTAPIATTRGLIGYDKARRRDV
jgi:hypothetical protein